MDDAATEVQRIKEEIRRLEAEIRREEESIGEKGRMGKQGRRQIQGKPTPIPGRTPASSRKKTLPSKARLYDLKERHVALASEGKIPPKGSPILQEPAPPTPPRKVRARRSFTNGIYFFLGKFSSRSQKNNLRKKLAFAGVEEEAEIWLGQVLLLALLFSSATFLAFWVVFKEAYVFTLSFYSGLAFGLTLAGATIHLNVEIEERKRRLEEVLPDAMQMIAANIAAGMSPIVALRSAARPELGPLEEDIKFATTKSLGTDSFLDALFEMGHKTNSEIFRKIVALFSASLRSGGHLSQLLENTAADIRNGQELRKDLISNTRLYAIFILFTVAIGTPLLLAVSIQFSTMVSSLQGKTDTGGIASQISSGPLISTPLPLDFLGTSALVIIVITCLLASSLLGVINTGSYSSGLKYSPFLAAFAVLFFYFLKDFALKAIMPMG